MIIRLSEIENEMHFAGEIEGSRFMGGENPDFLCVTPVRYNLLVRRTEQAIRITGSVRCALSLICARCTEEYSFPVDTALDVELEPASLLPANTELELRRDDMDVEYYEGEEIDLEPLIYEEVLLNIPMMPLCREDCLGLCNVCGKNRNDEACQCEQTSPTVLGEKLKSFLN
jgi:uncharacterized protein